MINPTLYKKELLKNIRNRQTGNLSAEEQSQANQTINKFFELFLVKHA